MDTIEWRRREFVVSCRENTLGALINLLGNVCSALGLGVDDETG
jgi:hypothetical protein